MSSQFSAIEISGNMVIDRKMELCWPLAPHDLVGNDQSMTRAVAMSFNSELVFNDKKFWRLPSVNELAVLLNPGSPWAENAYVGYYWSSASSRDCFGRVVYWQGGLSFEADLWDRYYLWPVYSFTTD